MKWLLMLLTCLTVGSCWLGVTQEGESVVSTEKEKVVLKPQDSLLVRADTPFTHTRGEDSITVSVVMDPGNKQRGFAHLKQ